MQRSIVGTATGAIASSLATIACCLPTSMLAAAGLAGVASLLAGAYPWLIGLSFVFLGAGAAQAWRAKRCGVSTNPVVLGLLILAVVIVVLAALFPQVIAGILADLTWGNQP